MGAVTEKIVRFMKEVKLLISNSVKKDSRLDLYVKKMIAKRSQPFKVIRPRKSNKKESEPIKKLKLSGIYLQSSDMPSLNK